MKIVLLHYSAPPVVGGVESVIGHQARLLAEAGHEVLIVAGRGAQTDERMNFVQIPLADSRHPMVLSIKEELDRGNIPDKFHDLVAIVADEIRNVIAEADCLIAHNVCSLNKNLILTAALKKFPKSFKVPALFFGTTIWHGQHRVIDQNYTKAIPGICFARLGRA